MRAIPASATPVATLPPQLSFGTIVYQRDQASASDGVSCAATGTRTPPRPPRARRARPARRSAAPAPPPRCQPAGARQRVARREQRAAVLVGNDRDRIACRCRCASAVISSLSIPISGRKSGSVATLPTTARFSSVCDATWPTTSPVTSACAWRSPADALGDPQHQPAVDDDAHRSRHGEHDLLLNVAERHEIQARALLPRGQQPHQLARLLLRGARQNRIAVEVHEGDRAAALHHPVRRDGRVDPAGQQAGHASRGAGRKPARRRVSLPKK